MKKDDKYEVCENCLWVVYMEPFQRGTEHCAMDGLKPIADASRHTCPAWEPEDMSLYRPEGGEGKTEKAKTPEKPKKAEKQKKTTGRKKK